MSINPWFIVAVLLLLVPTAQFTGQDTTVASTRQFTLPSHGLASFVSTGLLDLTKGYARIQAQPQNGQPALPAGFAIFGNRQNGVLISEAAVPASPLMSSGRLYVEIAGPVTTGLAIANPNTSPVTINFFFTDSKGNDFGQGTTTINAGSQIAVFLTDPPFNAPKNAEGTFTFTTSFLVSATALRGFTNERGEFLTTTLPVSIPTNSTVIQPTIQNIPQFADGGGWTTDIVLTNSTDSTITGNLAAFDQAGNGLPITLNATSSTTFAYSIPPRSFQTFQSSGASASVQTGFISIVAAPSSNSPAAFALYRFNNNGITTSESGGTPAEGGPSNADVYVEAAGDFAGSTPGSMQSGIAIAYTGAIQEVSLQFALFAQDGAQIGSSGTSPRNGPWQTVFMLNQLPGLAPITPLFRGILHIQAFGGTRFTGPPPISVMGLRFRYNERRELLMTSTPPLASQFFAGSSELLFPHLSVGGGYETQFLLFSDLGSTGTMYFFDQSGNPLSLPMQ
jgi:hypothetical protein